MPNIKLIHGEYISIHYKVIINALEELNDRYILVYNIFSNMSLASGAVSLYSLKKRQNRKSSLCMHTLHMPVIWENKLIDFKTDIILEIYPFVNDKKHFQLREADKTNSAVLWKSRTSGIYYIKDFGDYGGFFENGKHAIHIFAHVNGIGYYDALKELASRYGLISGEFSSTLKSKPFSKSFIE